MIHLICTNCSNHFFSRETNKEYKCPFCDIQLQAYRSKEKEKPYKSLISPSPGSVTATDFLAH